MLRPGFVCWLLLPFLISHNGLLRPASIGPWHTGLSTVLAAHVLATYQIICFRHLDLSFCSGSAPLNLIDRHFSSSIVTATAPLAERRTLLPSTPATRLRSMKWWCSLCDPSPLSFFVNLMRLPSTLSTVPT